MAATKGNEWWSLRSKHGRDKLFDTPELMWQAACEYFQWCEDNPLIETKAMSVSNGMQAGSEIQMVELPLKRPYTLQGLCRYLGCNTAYFRNFKNQERAKKEDFSSVITLIEETVYEQKFSGAATGFFNANIISRDLGLKETTQTDINVQAIPKIEFEMPDQIED